MLAVWVGPHNGNDWNWGTAANWDTNDVPDTAGETAVFSNAGTVGTVLVDGSFAVDAIAFDNSSDSYMLSGGTLTLTGPAPTITVSNSSISAAIGSTIAGIGGLTKAGDGTLALSGNLNHTGGTTIDGGTLTLNRANVSFPGLGSTGQFASAHTATVNSGATLQVNADWVMGDGLANQVVVNGGTLRFLNSDNYLGNIVLTGGAVTTSGGTHPWRTGYWGSGLIQVNASATPSTISGSLTFVGTATAPRTAFRVADGAAADDLIVSATIYDHSGFAGAMRLVKEGVGAMRVANSSSFSGGTTISQGTIAIAHSSALGTGAVTMGDANTGTSDVALVAAHSSGDLVASVPITVANQGSGAVTIGGVHAGGRAFFNGLVTLNRDVNLLGSGNDRTQFRGGITGTGNVTVTGGNRTTWSTTTATTEYGNGTAPYDFVGDIFITGAGTRLQLNSDFTSGIRSLGSHNVDVGTGARLVLPYNVDVTINALTGNGNIEAFAPGSGPFPNVLTIGANNGSGSFSGTLTQSGGATLSVVKAGSGTQTLTGNNSYSGATRFQSGVLSVPRLSRGNTLGPLGAALGQAENLVFDGGVLQYTGAISYVGVNAINRPFTVMSGGGTIEIANSAATVEFDSSSGANSPVGSSGLLTLTGAGKGIMTQILDSSFTGGVLKSGSGTWTLNPGVIHNGYLPASPGGATVLTGTTVADVDGIAGGIMNGGSIGANTNAEVFGYANDGTTATFALAFYDGTWTKAVKIQLSNSGGNVTATVLGARYWAGNVLSGFNYDTTPNPNTNSIATSDTAGGYGCKSLTLLVRTNSNAYSGGTTISRGTLQATHSGSMGADSVTLGDPDTGANDVAWLIAAGARLSNPAVVTNQGTGTAMLGSYRSGDHAELSGAMTFNRSVTLVDATGNHTVFTGRISGSAGTVTIAGNRVAFADGSNDFVGELIISSGTTYRNDAAGAIPDTTSVLASGIFQLNGVDETIGALNGSGSVTNITGANTLTIGGSDGSGAFTGLIADAEGSLSLRKTGAGSQTLAPVGDSLVYNASYIPASPATATVLANASVANIRGVAGGILSGGYVSPKDAPATAYNFSHNGTTATFALAVLQGEYTKAVKIQLTNSGGNVVARAIGAKYWSGNVLSDSFNYDTTSGATPQSVATSDGSPGYGCKSLTLALASYSGGLTVSQGTLLVGNAYGPGTGTIVLNDLDTGSHDTAFLATAPMTLANPVDVTASGTGVATLGTADIVSASNMQFSGTVTLGRDTTLQAGSSDRTTFAGQITGTGNVTVTSPFADNRRIVLERTGGAANDFAGDLYLGDHADLQLGVGNSVGNRTIPDSSNIYFAPGSRLRFAPGGADHETVGALISQSAGAGTVDVVTGGSAFSLTVGTGDDSGSFSGRVQNTSGSLRLVKTGAGTQTLTDPANSFRGGVTIGAGTLSVPHLAGGNTPSALGSALGTTPNLVFDGGVLEYTGSTVSGINRAFTLNAGGGTFRITDANAIVTWTDASGAGPAIGSGKLTKDGAGTLELGGAGNSYSGGTDVNAGTLLVNTSGSGTGTGPVAVNNGGILGGNGTIAGSVTSSGTGTVQPGNSFGILTVENDYSASTTFEINGPYLTAGTDYDQVVVNGAGNTIDLSQATVTFVSAGGGTVPALPHLITLIQNNTNNSIEPFSNLAQGATVTLGSDGNARSFIASYTGGDGNDLVLFDASAPTTVYVDNDLSGFYGQTIADADKGTGGAQPAIFGVSAFTTIGGGLGAVSGSGTVVVNGGTYAEAVTLSGTRSLRITGPDAAQTVVLNALTTAAGQNVQIDGASNLTVGDATSTIIGGTISGGGSLTKQGAGTITLSGTVANTYTGMTTILDGTLVLQKTAGVTAIAGNIAIGDASGTDMLQLGAANQIADTSVLSFTAGLSGNSAFFRLNGFDETVGGIQTTVAGQAPVIENNGGPATTSTLTVNTSADFAYDGILRNNSAGTSVLALTKSGSGKLTLSNTGNVGPTNYTGATTVMGGTLAASGGNGLSDGSNHVLSNAAGVQLLLNNNETIGSLSGGGALGGHVVLGANTLAVGADNRSPAAYGGVISGTGGLTKIGSGTLTLSGTSSSYTGLTTFEGGIVNVASLSDYGVTSSLGARTAAQETATGNGIGWWFRGGTLQYTGSTPQSTNRQIRVRIGNGATIDASGTGAGTLSFTFAGPNTNLFETGGTRTIQLTGSNTGNNSFAIPITNQGGSATSLAKTGTGTWVLTGASSYSGPTWVTRGTLTASGGSAIPNTSRVVVAGAGMLNVAASETIGSLTGIGPASVAAGATLTVGSDNTSASYSGVIGGAGNLAKTGTGTWTLTNSQAYGGSTTVSQGSLRLGADSVPTAGLAARYTFDSDASDASVNGNHGTISGGGTSLVTGIAGNALNFTGAQNVQVPYNSSLDISGSFTVSAWVNLNTAPGTFGILGTRVGGDTTFDYKALATSIHGDVGSGSAWINTSMDIRATDVGASGQGGSLSPGVWYLVTYVIDDAAKQFRLYLDGDLKQTIGYTGTPRLMKPGQTLLIGDTTGGEKMNGMIDDVVVYHRALTAAEVGTLYASAAPSGPVDYLPNGSAVTVASGATLNLNGQSESIGSLAGAGTVALGSGTLTTGADGLSTTFTGAMSGTGGLTKIGAGTFTLQGVGIAYTGSTLISSGTLDLNYTPGFNSDLTNDAALVLSGVSGTWNLNRSIAGTGTVTKTGAGAVVLGGSTGNTYSGLTTLVDGTLVLAKSSGLAVPGDLTIQGDADTALEIVRLDAPDQIADTAAVVVTDNAVLDLRDFDETIGALSGAGRVLSSRVGGPVGFTTDAETGISSAKTYTHLLDFNAGWSSSPAVASVNGVNFTNAGTSGGNWSGVPGSGTGNTTTGMADSGGMHELLKDFYYGGNPATVSLNGLTVGTTYELRLYQRTWSSPGTGERTQRITFDEDGAGPLATQFVFNEDHGGNPSYLAYRYTAGATSLTVRFDALNPSGGTYHFYGLSNEEVSSPADFGTLTVGDGSSTTFSGSIEGDRHFVKTGSGTLILSGANTYTGTTTVNHGTLLVHGSLADGTSAVDVIVAVDATLGGTGTIDGHVRIESGGHLAPGTSPAIQNYGHLSLDPESNFDVDLWGGTAGPGYDQAVVANSVSVSGAHLNLDFNSGAYTPAPGVTFTLIDNTSANPVTGEFVGKANNSMFIAGGNRFGIRYDAGTGNDVVLTSLPAAAIPSILYVNDQWSSLPAFDEVDGDLETGANEQAFVRYDAFRSIVDALAAYPTYAGPIVVNGGAYASADLAGGEGVQLRLVRDLKANPVENDVTVRSFSGNANDSVVTAFHGTGGNLIVDVGTDSTYSGTISGGGGLTKLGDGGLNLGQANSYGGGTSILGGSLRIGNAASLGSGDVTIDNGANLLLWWNTGSGIVANNFILNALGTVDNKAAIYGDGGSGGLGMYTLSGSIQLNATSNIGGNTANNILVTGQVTGFGGLTKGGTRTDENNTLTVTNPTNNYQGATTVAKGTLKLGAGEVLPHGANAGSVTVAAGAVLDLGAFDETINGLSGAGTVRRSGVISTGADGAAMISTSKNYVHLLDFGNNGGATVNGVAFGNVSTTSGTDWSLTGAGVLYGESGSPSGYDKLVSDFFYNGNPGTLTFSNLAVGETYEAVLYTKVGHWAGRPQNATFDEDGGGPISNQLRGTDPGAVGYYSYRFVAQASSMSISMAPQASGTFHWFAASLEHVTSILPKLTVGDANNHQFDGVITGPTAIVKQGSGQWTLTNANPYTGTTTIDAGRVRIDHSQALGVGAVSVAAGANLQIWAPHPMTVANNITLNGPSGNAAHPAINHDGGGGLVTLTGTITLAATSDIGVGGTSWNDLLITGRVTGPGGLIVDEANGGTVRTLMLANTANDYQGDTTILGGTLRVNAAHVIPDGVDAGIVTVNSGGTLDLSGHDETINGLSGNGRVVLAGMMTGPVHFSTDLGSDISATKTYTHLLDFYDDGVPAVVNGVTFTAAGAGGGANNWSLTGASSDHAGAGGTIPTYLDDAGMERLLRDFRYNGNPALLTLTGLTAGQTYEARLYNRQWGGDRTQRFTFDEDGAGPKSAQLTFNEDYSVTPSYIAYRYTAVSDGMGGALPLTITIQPQSGAGSYHLYGFTNEEVSAPTLTVGDASSTTFDGTISGDGSLVKQDAGTLTLGGPNSYAGTTTVNAGTLQIADATVAHFPLEGNLNDASGNGHMATAVGNPVYSSAGKFGHAITLNGSSQYLTVPYHADLSLNSYTVSLWVNIHAQPAVGASGPALVSTRNGGDTTFDLQYTQPIAGTFRLHADIGTGSSWLTTAADYTLPNALSGWNMITYTVNSTGYKIYINGTQVSTGTFTGTPLFMKSGQELSFGSQKAGGASYGSAGHLNGSLDEIAIFASALDSEAVSGLYFGSVGSLPATTFVSVASGATLDLNGVNGQAVVGLSDIAGAGGVVTSATPVNVTLVLNTSESTTFSGVIENGNGELNVFKTGSGTQVLSGANTYTGDTNISGGTLLVNGSTAAGSAFAVNNDALLGGTGVIGGAVTLSAGSSSTLSPGSPVSPTADLATGSLTLHSGTTLAVQINGLTADTQHDQVRVTGSVNLGGAALNTAESAIPGTMLGDKVVLIDNDGTDAVSGQFAGYGQGGVVTVNGQQFRIFYNGHDGNDVVLIRAGNGLGGNVDVAFVNEDWAAVVPGEDPDGMGPAEAFLVDAYSTIQDAIDNVNPGGIIYVLANSGAGYAGFNLSKNVQIRFIQDYQYSTETTVTLNGAVTLSLDADWVLYDGTVAGALVSVIGAPANLTTTASGTIDGDTAGTRSLNLISTADGTGGVVLGGAVGGGQMLSSATIGQADNRVASIAVHDLRAAGTVSLNTRGAISQGTVDAGADVTATALIAVAVTGIDLDTNVAFVTAVNSGDASIVLNEVDSLTVLGVTGGGEAEITALGALTVVGDVTLGGGVLLATIDKATGGDDLTVKSGVKVESTHGAVELRAGDDLTL
ncbi:MAG: autotransporter-associated beta strand repeat-containing protein, partial [Pirellulaceae bacterium]|nr:autotransporter-associated beta strand repeat-containing protein [Pirellulaceae bacterium]